MGWGGLIFIVVGIGTILGAGKAAEYNRFIRSQEVAKAEKRLMQAQGFTLLAKMRVNFHKSSLEAGKMDHFCCVLIGIVVIVLGVFLLFHPNGW